MSKETKLFSEQLQKLQSKISWLCQTIRWLGVVWLIWIFVRMTLPLLDADWWIDYYTHAFGLTIEPVTMRGFLLSRAVTYIDWIAASLIVIAGWKLFTGYLDGDIFSETAADRLKHLGWAAIIATSADLVIRPLADWVLSPIHFHTIPTLAYFIPLDLLHTLFGILLISLARIFRVAAEINAENKSFI